LTNLLSVLVSAALAAGVPPGVRSAVRTQTPSQGVSLTPEAERSLRRVVLGLEPNQTNLLMLPETVAWDPKTKDPRVRWLRRQVYRLNFELGHGKIFRHSPPYTRFFVAVPDPRTTPESLGNEETVLREHLRERVGWSDHVIDERVRFFSVPAPVPFPQDMAEPIGYTEKGQLVLGIGSDADDWYHQAVQRLVAAFPGEFVVRRLPGINTEGGDLAFVRLPEGGVGLLVGHNRVARFVQQRYPETVPGKPIPDAQIEEARRAYQQAFDGIETIVVGPEALRNPGLANPEIFHLDMLVAVLRTPSGVVAFVPTYEGSPIDAITHVHVSAEDVGRSRPSTTGRLASSRRAATASPASRSPISPHAVPSGSASSSTRRPGGPGSSSGGIRTIWPTPTTGTPRRSFSSLSWRWMPRSRSGAMTRRTPGGAPSGLRSPRRGGRWTPRWRRPTPPLRASERSTSRTGSA
jgi:hypothetical protein